MTVDELNRLPEEAVRTELSRCCGSAAWVERMLRARPFEDAADLEARAAEAWRTLGREDRLEAFRHHPRIGERAALERRFAATAAWAAEEQSGTAAAAAETLAALERGNREYEQRFGHVFIVCATGLGAEELRARLEERLRSDPAEELERAAEEQLAITRLRLRKLIEAPGAAAPAPRREAGG